MRSNLPVLGLNAAAYAPLAVQQVGLWCELFLMRFAVCARGQVSLLNGAAVSSTEKVDAANMAGAAAEGLLAIRRQHFAAGELDDGGGAVPPTAAGAFWAAKQCLTAFTAPSLSQICIPAGMAALHGHN